MNKLFALVLAFLVGTAMVTAPMGCQSDKKTETKKTEKTDDPTTGKKTEKTEEVKK